jgi:DMSO/TMAO reductase YedYZ molybdopterin-dependent catalytic subunit
MRAATLDRLLAMLVVAQLLTGLVSLRAGTPVSAPLFAVHGLLAGALGAAIALKLWRSVPRAIQARRWGALALASGLGLAAAAALGLGFAWVVSGRLLAIGPWTVLTLHVWAALVLVPVAVAHLLPRRWRLLRPSSAPGGGNPAITRRAALVTVGLVVAGGVAWAAANVLDAAAGGVRRFTGSRWLPRAGVPPATTFFGEGPPAIEPRSWRLLVDGAVARRLSLSLEELGRLGEVQQEAVLDCTSGWALQTTWRGVPLAAVLDVAGAGNVGRVTVRSATGWNASLPMAEARRALLATGVAGRPLPVANGAPCRLVAPERRGLEWVKWVTEIEVA